MRGITKMAMTSRTNSRYENRYENRYEGNYEPENRRDRRGRFAPKNEYREPYEREYRQEWDGEDYRMGHDKSWIVKPVEDRYRDERRMIGFENRMEHDSGDMRMHGGGHQQKEQMQHGGSHDQSGQNKLDQRTAVEWVNRMENSDGSRGEHFTMEQTERLRKNKGWECDPIEFWVAMNAVWSDGAATAKKYGLDKPEYWAERAKEFLCDEDAETGKMARYYKYIVKHD